MRFFKTDVYLEELEGVDELEQDETDLLLPRLRVQLGRGRQLGAGVNVGKLSSLRPDK
jgi:hypothetical protein